MYVIHVRTYILLLSLAQYNFCIHSVLVFNNIIIILLIIIISSASIEMVTKDVLTTIMYVRIHSTRINDKHIVTYIRI